MRLIPLRPDLNCATQELSRSLQAPAEAYYANVKHLATQSATTRNYEFVISPGDHIRTPRATRHLISEYDLVATTTARKSIAGARYNNGVCVHHGLGDIPQFALPSGEAKLDGVGSGVVEA